MITLLSNMKLLEAMRISNLLESHGWNENISMYVYVTATISTLKT